MPSGAEQRQVLIHHVHRARAGGVHAPVGEEAFEPLAAVSGGEADAQRRAGVGGEEPALDEALQVDGDVEAARRGCGARSRPHLAQHLRAPPPAARCSRRQSRVSTGTTGRGPGWSLQHGRTRAPPRSTSGAARARARRSARATGSAWMTSPSEESLTMAILARAARAPRPLRDAMPARARPGRSASGSSRSGPRWSGSWDRPRWPRAHRGAHRRALGHASARCSRCPWRARRGAGARSARRRCPPRRRPPRPPPLSAASSSARSAAGITGRPGPFSRRTEASELSADHQRVAERARRPAGSARGPRGGGRSSRWRAPARLPARAPAGGQAGRLVNAERRRAIARQRGPSSSADASPSRCRAS